MKFYTFRLTFDYTSAILFTYNEEQPIRRHHMARKYRDIVGMQLDMLVKTKRFNELNPTPLTRRASGELCTDPKSGKTYKVVG